MSIPCVVLWASRKAAILRGREDGCAADRKYVRLTSGAQQTEDCINAVLAITALQESRLPSPSRAQKSCCCVSLRESSSGEAVIEPTGREATEHSRSDRGKCTAQAGKNERADASWWAWSQWTRRSSKGEMESGVGQSEVKDSSAKPLGMPAYSVRLNAALRCKGCLVRYQHLIRSRERVDRKETKCSDVRRAIERASIGQGPTLRRVRSRVPQS